MIRNKDIEEYLKSKKANNNNVYRVKQLIKQDGIPYKYNKNFIEYNLELSLLDEYLNRVLLNIHNNKQWETIPNMLKILAEKYRLHMMTVEHLCNFYNIPISTVNIRGKETKIIDEKDIELFDKYVNDIKISGMSVKVFLTKLTSIKKYGYDSWAKTKNGREKLSLQSTNNAAERLEKAKATKLAKYGNENYVNVELRVKTYNARTEEQRETTRLKTIQTKIEKYGSLENAYKYMTDVYKQTMQEKYGVDNYFQLESSVLNNKENLYNRIKLIEEKYDATIITTLERQYGQGWSVYCKDIKKFNVDTFTLIPNSEIPKIIEYNNKTKFKCRSRTEDDIYNFIKNHYTGDIICNSKNIIKPKELDIYIPDYKLAIEYNGLYWHKNDKTGCLLKTELCEKNNIHLIHIFEDEWKYQEEKCKSLILSYMSNITEYKDYTIEYIDEKIANIFFNDNSLLNFIPGDKYIALKTNNEILLVISFSIDNDIIINGITTKLYTNINLNILIKEILQTFNKDIIIFVNRRLFNINEYKKIGFEIIEYIKPKTYITDKHCNIILTEILDDDIDISDEYSLIYDSGLTKMKLIK